MLPQQPEERHPCLAEFLDGLLAYVSGHGLMLSADLQEITKGVVGRNMLSLDDCLPADVVCCIPQSRDPITHHRDNGDDRLIGKKLYDLTHPCIF
jgi:hypothetical protein